MAFPADIDIPSKSSDTDHAANRSMHVSFRISLYTNDSEEEVTQESFISKR